MSSRRTRIDFVARAACLRGLCLVAVLSSAACQGTGAYYRAVGTYTPKRSLATVSKLDGAEDIVTDARVLAFKPPAPCGQPAAENEQVALRRTELLELPCRTLVAELEAQAIMAGYEVVSWRRLTAERLKESGAPDAVAAAYEAGADLVIAVAEEKAKFSPKDALELERRAYVATPVLPERRDRELVIDDPETVNARCRGALGKVLAEELEAVKVSLSVIDAAERRVIWRLDRIVPEVESPGGRFRVEHSAYVASDYTWGVAGPQTAVLGTVPVLFGLAMAVFPIVDATTQEEDESFELTKFALPLFGALFVTSVATVASMTNTSSSWPSADEVLCSAGKGHWIAPSALGAVGLAERETWLVRRIGRDVVGRMEDMGSERAR